MANNYVGKTNSKARGTMTAARITELYQNVGWIGRSRKVLRSVPSPFFDKGPGVQQGSS